jgi:Polyketide cyclase / dehydrase and lipid transport
VTELLLQELRNLASAAGERALAAAGERIGSMTDRLTEYAKDTGNPSLVAAVTGIQKNAEGKSPVSAALSGGFAGIKEKVKGLFGRGGKGQRPKKLKLTNIVESIDVGVPVRVAYNQWTQFEHFPGFMKKVESAERAADEKSNWKAQVWWSHRTWEATVVQQIPDYCIVWRSTGQKGHVDGSVTFHEAAPNLTRILLVMEYHPQGLFEHTGNIWRAQGRRARLEFKHFRRHVMTQTILHPDEVEGWRGEIRDGEVVKDHDTALAEEQEEQGPGEEERGRGEEEERGRGEEEERGRGEEEERGPEERGERARGRARRREEEEPEGEYEEEPEEEEPPEEPEERPARRRPARARAR